MGYAYGEGFTSRTHPAGKVHFEIKNGERIVLWEHDERAKVLDLMLDEAEKAYAELGMHLKLAGRDV